MIKVYYSSESNLNKQVISYVNASNKEILTIDIKKSNVTGTQWKEMAENLNCSIGDLIDKAHPKFLSQYNGSADLSENGWIKVLDEHPEVLTNPIVIIGDKFYQIKNPSDIEKHLEPNSKGFNERKYVQKQIDGDSKTIV